MRALSLIAIVALLGTFGAGGPARADETITLIHTGGLGEIFSGAATDPAIPTPEETLARLLDTRAKFPRALYIDSGNHTGWLGADKMAMFRTADALKQAKIDAAHLASRDMLYGQLSRNYYLTETELNLSNLTIRETELNLPLVGSATAPKLFEDRRPRGSIEKVVDGNRVRIVGVGRHERAKPNLKGWNSRFDNEGAIERALAEIRRQPTADFNIVLSDLPPADTDALAGALPRNSLALEQSDAKSRELDNNVRVLTKPDWWTIDTLEVRWDDDGVNRVRVDSEPIRKGYPARGGGILGGLFGGGDSKPRDNSRFAPKKPIIGDRIGSYHFFRLDDQIPTLVNEYRASERIADDSIANNSFYFYRWIVDDRPIRDVIAVERGLKPGDGYRFVVGVNTAGVIDYSMVFDSCSVNAVPTQTPRRILESIKGRRFNDDFDDIDPANYYGLEFEARWVKQDLLTALRLYREYRAQADNMTPALDEEGNVKDPEPVDLGISQDLFKN